MKFSLVFGVLVCWLEMVVVTEGQAYFRMRHISSGKVADAYSGGSSLRLWFQDDYREDEQAFYVDSSPYGCSAGYFIRNKKYPNLVMSKYKGLNFLSHGEAYIEALHDIFGSTCRKRWYIDGPLVKNMDENYPVLTTDGVINHDLTVEEADGSASQNWACDFI